MINVPQIVLSVAITIKFNIFNIAMCLNLIDKPNIQLQHLQITYEKINIFAKFYYSKFQIFNEFLTSFN